jgi:LemA protein
MNANTTQDQVNVTNQLDSQLATIIVTYENYPELQSITAVRDLMYELAGTENRIAVERMYYNENVLDYNSHIKSFPASIIAGWAGFEEREYYQSANAPPAP